MNQLNMADPRKEEARVLKSRIHEEIARYRVEYKQYYESHATSDSPKLRDTNPSVVVIPGPGLFGFGKSKRGNAHHDRVLHQRDSCDGRRQRA